ncbi:4'-phosphopantetheinyl transferase superfamily protein [Micromonospora sp. WMMD882]|uniref:4'-phosphopantetheinyl transferase family protein n=1 Tax=Micromonospora sp. WMMD882 TaxID=3015151 RepID=UPI00248ABB90|nr:4'-phosphopantetheinyl transferase superfamily protein [Micromonospora sp. WMMD882]WBB80922.1 4'-phosphopantetheinyl transferase superfamily protein [Micromonospora sp. WMMD882]
MSQLPVPGRDAVYVWVDRVTGGQPETTRRMVTRAAVTLLDRAPVTVWRDGQGRPRVRAGGVELPVSVSHVDGVVAVAACRHATVGVDVERRRPVPAQALARRWFEPAAATWVRGRPSPAEQADAFLLLWTAKEAVGKALGLGLRAGGLTRAVPLPAAADGTADPGGSGPLLRAVPGGAGTRVGHPDAGPELVLAVAVVGPAREVVVLGPDRQVAVEQAGRAGHDVAARSASVERTSLPVVVRGSWDSRRRTRGRL